MIQIARAKGLCLNWRRSLGTVNGRRIELLKHETPRPQDWDLTRPLWDALGGRRLVIPDYKGDEVPQPKTGMSNVPRSTKLPGLSTRTRIRMKLGCGLREPLRTRGKELRQSCGVFAAVHRTDPEAGGYHYNALGGRISARLIEEAKSSSVRRKSEGPAGHIRDTTPRSCSGGGNYTAQEEYKTVIGTPRRRANKPQLTGYLPQSG
jgi:hypothetical protein